jgi:hypothetical protein
MFLAQPLAAPAMLVANRGKLPRCRHHGMTQSHSAPRTTDQARVIFRYEALQQLALSSILNALLAATFPSPDPHC